MLLDFEINQLLSWYPCDLGCQWVMCYRRNLCY